MELDVDLVIVLIVEIERHCDALANNTLKRSRTIRINLGDGGENIDLILKSVNRRTSSKSCYLLKRRFSNKLCYGDNSTLFLVDELLVVANEFNQMEKVLNDRLILCTIKCRGYLSWDLAGIEQESHVTVKIMTIFLELDGSISPVACITDLDQRSAVVTHVLDDANSTEHACDLVGCTAGALIHGSGCTRRGEVAIVVRGIRHETVDFGCVCSHYKAPFSF